jgi:hypothetical protein
MTTNEIQSVRPFLIMPGGKAVESFLKPQRVARYDGSVGIVSKTLYKPDKITSLNWLSEEVRHLQKHEFGSYDRGALLCRPTQCG